MSPSISFLQTNWTQSGFCVRRFFLFLYAFCFPFGLSLPVYFFRQGALQQAVFQLRVGSLKYSRMITSLILLLGVKQNALCLFSLSLSHTYFVFHYNSCIFFHCTACLVIIKNGVLQTYELKLSYILFFTLVLQVSERLSNASVTSNSHSVF